MAINDLSSSSLTQRFNGAYGLASAFLGLANPAAGVSMSLVGLALGPNDEAGSVFDSLPQGGCPLGK